MSRPRTALARARAIRRYDRMTDPAEACLCLLRRWPPEIAEIVAATFWPMLADEALALLDADRPGP